MATPDLVVHGDWGTSRMRLVLMEDGRRVDQAEGPGIGALPGSPAQALLATLAPWRGLDLRRVVLCGMAGSRNGVVEAPYAPCPADATAWAQQAAKLRLDGLDILVAPGVAGETPTGAPDVMRGEETQIFGAMALDPALARGERRIVLPGTHSKWSRIEGGKVAAFQTFLTGELFALLKNSSTLTLGAVGEGGEDEGFAHGLRRAGATGLLGALFEARSAQLRLGRSRGWAVGFLSGLIIGSEVAEAVAAFGAGPVTLIGDASLTRLYGKALAARSVEVALLDGEACVLAGLQIFEDAWRQGRAG